MPALTKSEEKKRVPLEVPVDWVVSRLRIFQQLHRSCWYRFWGWQTSPQHDDHIGITGIDFLGRFPVELDGFVGVSVSVMEGGKVDSCAHMLRHTMKKGRARQAVGGSDNIMRERPSIELQTSSGGQAVYFEISAENTTSAGSHTLGTCQNWLD